MVKPEPDPPTGAPIAFRFRGIRPDTHIEANFFWQEKGVPPPYGDHYDPVPLRVALYNATVELVPVPPIEPLSWATIPNQSYTDGGGVRTLDVRSYLSGDEATTAIITPLGDPLPPDITFDGSTLTYDGTGSIGSYSIFFLATPDLGYEEYSDSLTVTVEGTSGAEPVYPLRGGVWQGAQEQIATDPNLQKKLAIFDFFIWGSYDSLVSGISAQLSTARARNPSLITLHYCNFVQVSKQYYFTTHAGPLRQYFVNPVRGGAGRANDGIMRTSGTEPWPDDAGRSYIANWSDPTKAQAPDVYGYTAGANVLDYVNTYDGSGGVASSDTDFTKPRLGERPRDFKARREANWTWIVSYRNAGLLDGLLNDISTEHPTISADYNNDGVIEDRGAGNPTGTIPTKWRESIARSIKSTFGPNHDGLNPPALEAGGGTSGRTSDGRAWFPNGGWIIGNTTGLSNDYYWPDFESDTYPTWPYPEYTNMFHGGMQEFAMMRTGIDSPAWSNCGIMGQGTTSGYSTGFDLLNYDLQFQAQHFKPFGLYNIPCMYAGVRPMTYDAARYAFVAALVGGHYSTIRNGDNSVFNQVGVLEPVILDEDVAGDWRNMTADQIYAKRKWLGYAIDPPWPNHKEYIPDGTTYMGMTYYREFQWGLAIIIPGRTNRKNDWGRSSGNYDNMLNLSEVVNFPLPSPNGPNAPAGGPWKWQRILGAEDPSWNNGQDVGATITLGTSAQNINRNAIVLKRVSV